jgi:hypothetical protein
MREGFVLCAALAAVAVVGCLEAKEEYTVNPDGSGKVVVEAVVPAVAAPAAPGEKADPDLAAKLTARDMLDQSVGIDAWSDVTFGRTDDGRVRFKGAAYFKDLSKVRLYLAGLPPRVLSAGLAKDEKGALALTIEGPQERRGAKAPPAPKVPDAEVAQRVAAQRDAYRQRRPMMEKSLANFKIEMTFRLPGTVAEATNLQKDAGGVRLVLEGPKMIQALDQLMADEAYMRDLVRSGADVGSGNPSLVMALNQRLFGAKAPVRARLAGDAKPILDYEGEAKAARDQYPKMIERLGLDRLPPVLMPSSGVPGSAAPPAK